MALRSLGLLVLIAGCGGATGTGSTDTTTRHASADPSTQSPEATTLGLPGERHPAPGLVTGGQPDRAALTRAAELGVSAVITLRGENEAGFDEERQTVRELGMEHVSIPVTSVDDLTADNARALDQAIANAKGDVIVHCGSGNRAGAIIALREFHLREHSAQESLDRGLAAGLTRWEAAVRAHFEDHCASHPDFGPCAP